MRTRGPNKTKRRRERAKWLMPLDQEIMRFLWKWKASTAVILHLGAVPQEKARAFNKRLTKLETNGVIEQVSDFETGRKLWQLTELGHGQIRSTLPSLKDAGFRSPSLSHDFACLALILGEWVFQKGEKPIIYTDQELLRVEEDSIPEWVPSKMPHRPDGFLKIRPRGVQTAIAFEAELSVKGFDKYSRAILAYRYERKLAQVVWMYRDPSFLNRFIKAKAEQREDSMNYHVFFSMEEYLRDGWNTVVVNERSEKLRTLRELLRGYGGVEGGEIAGTKGSKSKIAFYADKKKYLCLKKTCACITCSAASDFIPLAAV